MTKQLPKTEKDINYTFSLSQISHEISNPLTLIYSTIQLLTHKHPELDKDELWAQLILDVDYLKQLTVSLSAYNHSNQLNIQTIDMNLLLSEIESAWSTHILHSNRLFICHISAHLPMINCDPVKIKQCLMNLIKNSFEATSEHDTIKLSAVCSANHLILTVSDTGKGMDENQLEHIFEPFTTYKSGGSGLGLSITKRIITAHQGSIEAISTQGTGSDFIIKLPLQLPDTH